MWKKIGSPEQLKPIPKIQAFGENNFVDAVGYIELLLNISNLAKWDYLYYQRQLYTNIRSKKYKEIKCRCKWNCIKSDGLSNAYLQIELDKESKPFTTISTTFRFFRYFKMPFGISNAPAIFQSLSNEIVAWIPHTAVFLDLEKILRNIWEISYKNFVMHYQDFQSRL